MQSFSLLNNEHGFYVHFIPVKTTLCKEQEIVIVVNVSYKSDSFWQAGVIKHPKKTGVNPSDFPYPAFSL